jgi:hypothetical protein
MSKKLTKSELEFLVDLITNKIVEKKQQERNQVVENDPIFIEFMKKVDGLNSLREKLSDDYHELNKEFRSKISFFCNYNVQFQICSVDSYQIRKDVEKKLLYEQIVLGGIGEDLIDKIVNELS